MNINNIKDNKEAQSLIRQIKLLESEISLYEKEAENSTSDKTKNKYHLLADLFRKTKYKIENELERIS